MGSYKSKEDDIARIFISIFVTNFPETFSTKDLFHTCKQYGHVVDSFIPTKRSKAGKRFGFVRFINVFNNERLGQVKVNVSKEPCNSYVEALKGQSQSYSKATESSPLLVLDDECLASKDLTKELWVLMEFASLDSIKLFRNNVSVGSWFSQIKQASMEFMTEGRIAWVKVEGILFKLWSGNTFKRVASKWGQLLDIDDQEDVCFHSKRLCIHSKIMRSINKDFKIIFRGKVYWIQAKETPGWVPDFADDSDDEEQNGDEGNEEGQNNLDTVSNDHVSDEEEIPETMFEDTGDKHCNVVEEPTHQRSEISKDPFNLYPLLKQKRGNDMNGANSMDSLKYPPGFTHNASNDENVVNVNEWNEEKVDNDDSGRCSKEKGQTDASESVCSGHFKKSKVPRISGSILNLLDEVVKVWQVMGYKMDGCMANMEDIIHSQGEEKENKMENMELSCVRRVWGNVNFEYVHSDSVGNSRGILCAWDPNELLIIVVYAPHDLSEKKVLWEYLVHVISRWNGEVVLMGDFNEVRYKTDKFGSVFDARGANMFNSFITDACIVKVHLGGYLTWCHKSATKMSKLDRFLVSESLPSLCPNLNAATLERYLSDHRPILIRKSNVDYGLTPFRFFHHWMEMEGFCKFVKDVWKGYSCDESNALKRMMEKLKYLKIRIKEWIRLNRICVKSGRAKLIKDLEDVDAIIASGNGNEEVVNKRMGVINDLHNVDKLNSVEMAQKAKIRWAIEEDENSSYFHGLINKKRSIVNIRGIMEEGRWINDPKNVKMEFYSHFSQRSRRPDGRLVTVHTRPISLIGSLYKIIAKIMANRLAGVLGDLVHEVQSAFIAERQILDGPLILNEVLQWCKDKKKHALVFKVDFEKVYDSVRWKGINFLEYMSIKVGNGNNTSFWGDNWIGEVNSKSCWIKFNISRCGIVINSIMCDICHNGVEMVTHLFFSCCLVREVTCLICRWWDMPFEEYVSYEDWLEWILRLRLPAKNKMMFEGVFYVLWWHV
nr:RNA-directed DNA polymerase, eukaryota [Tanacetum cinerariifolium]